MGAGFDYTQAEEAELDRDRDAERDLCDPNDDRVFRMEAKKNNCWSEDFLGT